jgi:uncharacterized delta-60 repeat protein
MPLRSRLLRSLALALAVPLVVPSLLGAADPGDIDATFGVGGSARLDGAEAGMIRLGSAIKALTVLPDGRSIAAGVMAGRVFVARWLADGSVDTSFADNGTAMLAGPYLSDQFSYSVGSLVVLPDGKILVAGERTADDQNACLVWRIEPSGAPDRSWNQGRPFVVKTDPLSTGIAAFPMPDGSVTAVGSVWDGSSDFTRVLATWRLRPDGTMDTAYGSGGVARTSVTSNDFGGAAIQPDGRIVVVGSGTLANDDALLVVRLTTSGALDTSFNGTGALRTVFPTSNSLADSNSRMGNAVAIQANGRIVVAGSWNFSSNNTKFQSAIVGVTAGGALDSTFGAVATPGVFPLPHTNPDEALAIHVLGDQRIVAAGYASPNGWVARFSADGRTKEFETSITGASGTNRWIEAVAVLGDGSYLFGGRLGESTVEGALRIRTTTAGAWDRTYAGTTTGLAGNITHRNADLASSIAIDTSGRAVVGYTSITTAGLMYRLAYAGVARFTTDGAPDAGFSGDGKTRWRPSDISLTTNPLLESTSSIATDAGGRVLVGGFSDQVSGGSARLAIAAYLGDGTPDPTFGAAGRVLLNYASSSVGSQDIQIVVQPDGKPVVLVSAATGSPNQFRILRFTTSGSVDTTFGNAGAVDLVPLFGFSRLSGFARTPDGRLLVVGVPKSGSQDVQVGRLLGDGAWDTTFDTDGIAAVELGTASFNPYRIVPLQDGRIAVATITYQFGAPTGDSRITRLLAGGGLDSGFGSGGTLIYNPTAGNDRVAAFAEVDGRLLVAGTADLDGPDPQVRLSAHLGNGSLDPSFGTGGAVQRQWRCV